MLSAHLAVAQLSVEPDRNYWDCLRILTSTASVATTASSASGTKMVAQHEEQADKATGPINESVKLMAPESFTLRLAPFVFAAEDSPDATTALPVSVVRLLGCFYIV